MPYNRAVEVETLRENAQEVLRSVGALSPEDAMNALGAAISNVVIANWPPQARGALLDGWFTMVRGSLVVGE